MMPFMTQMWQWHCDLYAKNSFSDFGAAMQEYSVSQTHLFHLYIKLKAETSTEY